jgi:hypothetical protein
VFAKIRDNLSSSTEVFAGNVVGTNEAGAYYVFDLIHAEKAISE